MTETQTDPQSPDITATRRCTATCADGSPCQGWAVRGSDPPRCAPHGGGSAPVGAPVGNQNARTHGFYASTPAPSATWSRDPSPAPCRIDDVIADLHRKQQSLSHYIDEHIDHLHPDQLARFLRIHAQSCSRLGRLLRDRHVLISDGDEGVSEAIQQALAELSQEWGTPL